jgi:hypothetical protein
MNKTKSPHKFAVTSVNAANLVSSCSAPSQAPVLAKKSFVTTVSGFLDLFCERGSEGVVHERRGGPVDSSVNGFTYFLSKTLKRQIGTKF